MNEAHTSKDKWFRWGIALACVSCVPVWIEFFNSFRGISENKATGLGGVARGHCRGFRAFWNGCCSRLRLDWDCVPCTRLLPRALAAIAVLGSRYLLHHIDHPSGRNFHMVPLLPTEPVTCIPSNSASHALATKIHTRKLGHCYTGVVVGFEFDFRPCT